MNDRQRFDALVLPHLDAAYNLARWLVHDPATADDVVQEAAMRAFRYLASLSTPDARPWLLGIVRNTCYSVLKRRREEADRIDFDETVFEAAMRQAEGESGEPDGALRRRRTRAQVDAALRALSPVLREVVVLREFAELEYAQIATVVGVPVGTVMSRLSRARDRLRIALSTIDLER